MGLDNTSRAVIMLGAGSSCSYGFPLATQLAQTMKEGLKEIEENIQGFSENLNMSEKDFIYNFDLTKSIVNSNLNKKYPTLDRALMEFKLKEIRTDLHGNFIKRNENIDKVFWRVCSRSLQKSIEIQSSTDSPNAGLCMQIDGLLGGMESQDLLKRDYHIDYIIKKYPHKLQKILNSIIIDFNYDNWFPYRFSYLSKQQDMTPQSIEFRSNLSYLENQLQQLVQNRKPAVPPNSHPTISDFLDKNKSASFRKLLRKKAAPFRNEKRTLERKIKQLDDSKPMKELQPFKNYFQPHGSFQLNKSQILNQSFSDFWSQRKNNSLADFYPATCYEYDKNNLRAVNMEKLINHEKANTVLILGVSPMSFKQNTEKLLFNNDIDNVFFTCFEPSNEETFMNVLEEKFPNAKKRLYKNCSSLWDGFLKSDTVVLPHSFYQVKVDN